MSRTRDIVQEIVEARARRKSDLATAELFSRLLDLDAAFDKRRELRGELLKYFPVALVALMETYFRLTVKELVDHGDPYLSNAASLFSGSKLDFGVLRGLHGRLVSLGEVIAHTLALSSLSHINTHLSTLLGRDFLAALRTVYDRWDHEIQGNPKSPILKDPDTTFAHVARTFELRHIICHEAATDFPIEPDAIEQSFFGTSLVLKASRELIDNTLHPGAPLTQTDMNIAAATALEKTLSELDAVQATIRARVESERATAFDGQTVCGGSSWRRGPASRLTSTEAGLFARPSILVLRTAWPRPGLSS